MDIYTIDRLFHYFSSFFSDLDLFGSEVLEGICICNVLLCFYFIVVIVCYI